MIIMQTLARGSDFSNLIFDFLMATTNPVGIDGGLNKDSRDNRSKNQVAVGQSSKQACGGGDGGLGAADGEGVEAGKGVSATEGGEAIQNQNKNFWAEKTAKLRNRERGVQLRFHPQVQSADKLVIPKEMWDAATSKFKNAVVGFVFGSKPFLGRVKGFARTKWGDETVVKVSQLNDGIFLLNFATEEKKLEALIGGPWTFDNRPFIMKSWSEYEEYKCGSINALPVWVRLPGIKAHLADTDILGLLCSKLGRPICTDGVTGDGLSYNFARVCIEMYADVEFQDVIEYEDPYGNKCVQQVMYEWKPPRCPNCCNFGHVKERCPEPNLEDMLEELREHERRSSKLKDKIVLSENEEECVAETPDTQNFEECAEETLRIRCAAEAPNSVAIGIGERQEEEDLCSMVPDTQIITTREKSKDVTIQEMGGTSGGNVTKVAATEGFKQYISRSALKRARQKEKRHSGSEGSGGMKEKGESNSGSRSKVLNDRLNSKDAMKKKVEKRKKVGSTKSKSY